MQNLCGRCEDSLLMETLLRERVSRFCKFRKLFTRRKFSTPSLSGEVLITHGIATERQMGLDHGRVERVWRGGGAGIRSGRCPPLAGCAAGRAAGTRRGGRLEGGRGGGALSFPGREQDAHRVGVCRVGAPDNGQWPTANGKWQSAKSRWPIGNRQAQPLRAD